MTKKILKLNYLQQIKIIRKLIKQAKFFNVKNIVITDYNSFLKATKLLSNTKVQVLKTLIH